MTRDDELKFKRLQQWCVDVNNSAKINEKWDCMLLMDSKWRELIKTDLPGTFSEFVRLVK